MRPGRLWVRRGHHLLAVDFFVDNLTAARDPPAPCTRSAVVASSKQTQPGKEKAVAPDFSLNVPHQNNSDCTYVRTYRPRRSAVHLCANRRNNSKRVHHERANRRSNVQMSQNGMGH